ncbi:MAG: hypothetical protein ACK4ZT_02225, partial [Microcystis sp.]|uniref:hypothetical protein n=1 Tax=Microcystis sp. TaxID=1127 RepID=UPI00391B3871
RREISGTTHWSDRLILGRGIQPESGNKYVEMVRQEHPESERQQLAADLWHYAHSRGHQSSVIRFAFQSTDYWKYSPTPTRQ